MINISDDRDGFELNQCSRGWSGRVFGPASIIREPRRKRVFNFQYSWEGGSSDHERSRLVFLEIDELCKILPMSELSSVLLTVSFIWVASIEKKNRVLHHNQSHLRQNSFFFHYYDFHYYIFHYFTKFK